MDVFLKKCFIIYLLIKDDIVENLTYLCYEKNPENRVGLPDNTAMICYKFVLNFVYYLIFKQCENIVSKIQFGE